MSRRTFLAHSVQYIFFFVLAMYYSCNGSKHVGLAYLKCWSVHWPRLVYSDRDSVDDLTCLSNSDYSSSCTHSLQYYYKQPHYLLSYRAIAGNSRESAIQKFPAGIPGNYWILGENFREFRRCPIFVNFCSDIVKARYHANSFSPLFEFKSPISNCRYSIQCRPFR